MREQVECVELCLGIDEELTVSLWVRIKEKTDKSDIIMGVCYGPAGQKEPTAQQDRGPDYTGHGKG